MVQYRHHSIELKQGKNNKLCHHLIGIKGGGGEKKKRDVKRSPLTQFFWFFDFLVLTFRKFFILLFILVGLWALWRYLRMARSAGVLTVPLTVRLTPGVVSRLREHIGERGNRSAFIEAAVVEKMDGG